MHSVPSDPGWTASPICSGLICGRHNRGTVIERATVARRSVRQATLFIEPAKCDLYVRFSNRPFGVKHFQTIHRCGVDVARGLALLFGIGTKALPVWDSRTRRNNLCGGLIVRLTTGPSGHTNSPHPSSREGHHSTARWSSISFYPVRF
jgi:hypothetical protein